MATWGLTNKGENNKTNQINLGIKKIKNET